MAVVYRILSGGAGLAVANPLAMVFGPCVVQRGVRLVRHRPSTVLANYSPPLVLKEALVNATTRVPFERNLATGAGGTAARRADPDGRVGPHRSACRLPASR